MFPFLWICEYRTPVPILWLNNILRVILFQLFIVPCRFPKWLDTPAVSRSAGHLICMYAIPSTLPTHPLASVCYRFRLYVRHTTSSDGGGDSRVPWSAHHSRAGAGAGAGAGPEPGRSGSHAEPGSRCDWYTVAGAAGHRYAPVCVYCVCSAGLRRVWEACQTAPPPLPGRRHSRAPTARPAAAHPRAQHPRAHTVYHQSSAGYTHHEQGLGKRCKGGGLKTIFF